MVVCSGEARVRGEGLLYRGRGVLTSYPGVNVLGALAEEGVAQDDGVLARSRGINHLCGFGGRHVASWSTAMCMRVVC